MQIKMFADARAIEIAYLPAASVDGYGARRNSWTLRMANLKLLRRLGP